MPAAASSLLQRVSAHLASLRVGLAQQRGRLSGVAWPRHGLAARLRLALVVCSASLVVIALAYWRASAGTGEAADTFAAHQDYAVLAGRLAQQVSESRRLQTAYAQRLDDADRQALLQVQAELARTLARLGSERLRLGAAAPLEAVAGHVDAFAEGIASLNARVDEMGSGQDGLRGRLESAGDALEAAIEPLDASALQAHVQRMRHYEARFLLGGDTRWADRVSEEKLPSSWPWQRRR